MNEIRDIIRERVLSTGAVAVGFAAAGEIETRAAGEYDAWIGEGCHSGMDYLARHALLKRHPRNVLEGVRSVVSIAYSYAPAVWRAEELPVISCYAYGLDYHDVLRRRLSPVVDNLKERLGGEWRVCIDSAPLAERYWAVKAGIGKRGLNGSVIVDHFGSYIFLVELLTTLSVASESPEKGDLWCEGCGACVRACPQGALRGDGTLDSRRCLNYLTIEHRGEWEGESREAMQTSAGHHTLYGCDICQRVCPHNRDIPPTTITEFSPLPDILTLDREALLSMDQASFSRIFRGSPIKRGKLAGLQRNARNLS